MESRFTAQEPGRLDAFLASQLPDVSRSAISKSIKSGGVTVNGNVTMKPSYHLHESDQVLMQALQDTRHKIQDTKPLDLHLDVLYEDDDCLVINKPAGIAVHPGNGMSEDEMTLLSGLEYLQEHQKRVRARVRVRYALVHRLDKDTTGCLLVAKNDSALAKLQKQFKDRTVQKTYLALVFGIPKQKEATIDAPIGRNVLQRTKMSIFRTSTSREAQTTYRMKQEIGPGPEPGPGYALVECDLHTGRTHQIRVHLSSIGHPILGDDTYGTEASKKFSKELGVERMCLHSWKLSFESLAGGRVEVEATLPSHFSIL